MSRPRRRDSRGAEAITSVETPPTEYQSKLDSMDQVGEGELSPEQQAWDAFREEYYEGSRYSIALRQMGLIEVAFQLWSNYH